MRCLDLTLPTPELNLACDEALLEACEGGGEEVLRLWEPASFFVVLGYGNRIGLEVNREACRRLGLPVLRRCSGGGAVVQGPGCLSYSLVLRTSDPRLDTVTGTNRFVMGRHREALGPILGDALRVEGDTDLALGRWKISGNAQRRRRQALLFHGSFLLATPIGLIEEVLPLPSRQPQYRHGRAHRDFLLNIGLRSEALKQALRACWNASELLIEVPLDAAERLARDKYASAEWTAKF